MTKSHCSGGPSRRWPPGATSRGGSIGEPRRYDLVLTDETMPDLSGVELARELRRVRPELPIVMMSGYSGAQLTERARAAGAGEVLRKPLVRRDIAEALARALQ